MQNPRDISEQADLAFAAYVNLSAGLAAGALAARLTPLLGSRNANLFANTWTVQDQYNEVNGVSATVFERLSDARRFLAIRGTEFSSVSAALWDLNADLILTLGFPQSLNPQYVYLSAQVQKWLNSGVLTPGFTVAGHSLGGYLAGGLAIQYNDKVGAVYTFNAPGIGGAAVGGAYQVLKIALGLENLSIVPRTYNLRGASGLSLIAGLGAQIAPPISVEIESDPGLGFDNHSIARIADSLAVHGTIALLNPNLSVAHIGQIVAAASSTGGSALEQTLNSIARVFGLPEAIFGNRESLYAAKFEIDRYAATNAVAVEAIKLLSTPELVARAIGSEGLAYRYALRELNPMVFSGSAAIHSILASGVQYELQSEADPEGLSLGWVSARAEFLMKYLDYNISDAAISVAQLAGFYADLDRNVQFGSLIGSRPRIVFGKESEPNTLIGLNSTDRLFGGSVSDTLVGGFGSDHLEGGAGADTLRGGPGEDRVEGGAGYDTYIHDAGDGFDTVFDVDGSGVIVYKGRALSGGTQVRPGVYRDAFGVEYIRIDGTANGSLLLVDNSLYVEQFSNGVLGIQLTGEPEEPDAPSVGDVAFLYLDSADAALLDDDFEPGDAWRRSSLLLGSGLNDRIEISSYPGDFIGRAGDDTFLYIGNGDYAGSVDLGAGDDYADLSLVGSANSAQIIGGGGGDYLIGSMGADSIWGDSHQLYEFEVGTGNGHEIRFLALDRFHYTTWTDEPSIFIHALPVGYGVFDGLWQNHGWNTPAEDPLLGLLLGAESGAAMQGSIEPALQFVIGTDATFDDYIVAGAGDDRVVGGSGDDEIHGDAGNDTLYGDYPIGGPAQEITYARLAQHLGEVASVFGRPGNDYLDGGEGDDVLFDLSGGSDTLIGGAGNDRIESDERHWTADMGPMRNRIEGGAGDDDITLDNATGGFDIVDGGEGNDRIRVGVARHVEADEFGEVLFRGETPGRAWVRGGSGNDHITVFADQATVDGGTGDDAYWVSGDTVVSDAGGADTLHISWAFDMGAAADPAALMQIADFEGFSYTVQMTTRRVGNDLETTTMQTEAGVATPLARLRITGWYDQDARPIERILTQAETPTEWTPLAFEQRGEVHVGSLHGDTFTASDRADRLFGLGGDDWLDAGAGNDALIGGRGNDMLLGGEGNDTYYFALGDGDDVIADAGGSDEIRFGPGIARAQVEVAVDLYGTTLTIAGGGTVRIEDGDAATPSVERVRFDDGEVLALATLYETARAGWFPEFSALVFEPPSGPPAGGSDSSPGELAPASTIPISPAVLDTPALEAPANTLRATPGELLASQRSVFPSERPDTTTPADPERAIEQGLDLHRMLTAMEGFDIGADLPAESRDASPLQTAERQTDSESARSVSALALTHALLQFHLEHSTPDDLGATPPAWNSMTQPMPGLALTAVLDGAVGGELAGLTQRLQPFQGLREGLNSLGAL